MLVSTSMVDSSIVDNSSKPDDYDSEELDQVEDMLNS